MGDLSLLPQLFIHLLIDSSFVCNMESQAFQYYVIYLLLKCSSFGIWALLQVGSCVHMTCPHVCFS